MGNITQAVTKDQFISKVKDFYKDRPEVLDGMDVAKVLASVQESA